MTKRQVYTELGNRLRLIRVAFSDESQKAWATKNEFNPTQYNNWERGERRITIEAATKLADRYGLTLDYVFRGRVDGLPKRLLDAL